jgi:ankyrin repeat protein
MYVCMYVYMYIHTHTCTHARTCVEKFLTPQVVEILAAEGADVNAESIDGDTPLHCAAYNAMVS